MTLVLLLAVLLPTTLVPVLFAPGGIGILARRAGWWAALPTLLLSCLPDAYPTLELPWFLIGVRLELDPMGRVFLVAAALLWTVSGVFAASYIARPGRRRFLLFFLLTMTGNLGLPIAADAVTFYLFFALMTFAGYGLIVHRADVEARRAGRIYLILAVIGEMFLLAGLLLAARAAGSTDLDLIPAGVGRSSQVGLTTLFLLLGFAIKAGAVPLHVWLPLAHPVAPTPASAVLSGSMIKGGLLGWLRFLPLGELAQPDWATTVIGLGILAAFFGAVVGVVQTDPKTVLAYSSISQMGLMNVGLGVALGAPGTASLALTAVTFYAAHHGLGKGVLFLGVGVAGTSGRGTWKHRIVLGGLALVAAALAGMPFTSGYFAKSGLKGLLPQAPGPWAGWLEWLLPISAAATTLLMARFLLLTASLAGKDEQHRFTPGLWAPWALLLISAAAVLWVLPGLFPISANYAVELPHLETLHHDLLPIGAALLLYPILRRSWPEWASGNARPRIEPGDLLGPIERAIAAAPRPDLLIDRAANHRFVPALALRWYHLYSESERDDLLVRLELALTRWRTGLALVIAVTAALMLLFSLSFRGP